MDVIFCYVQKESLLGYMIEITRDQRLYWTLLEVTGNKKGQIQDYPETGLKYVYGGDAGN